MENEGLRGEAKILSENLEELKSNLRKVKDYATKLDDITRLKVQAVSKKTGIGPLSREEFKIAMESLESPQQEPEAIVPLGLNIDKLTFKPLLDQITQMGKQSFIQALDLQKLLSTLSEQKNMLASIPTFSPVKGWVTSGFGKRISPFTGQTAIHHGIDVASSVGAPILAPADGVVIFSGVKEGFGNFIMLAHGYGIVSCYGHNAQNLVQPGQRILRGEQIATVGMTGRTTGPHVHYEVVVDGKLVDPKKFILDMNSVISFDDANNLYMSH